MPRQIFDVATLSGDGWTHPQLKAEFDKIFVAQYM